MTADPKALDGIAAAFWLDLCEKDDRTSPEEYPDMCLITQEELAEMLGYVFHLRSATITHLTAQLAEAEAGEKALLGILENCSVESGVCCCGDNMETHPEPMSCGHSPVDSGEYAYGRWLERRQALTATERKS